jgi:hypothetical protein
MKLAFIIRSNALGYAINIYRQSSIQGESKKTDTFIIQISREGISFFYSPCILYSTPGHCHTVQNFRNEFCDAHRMHVKLGNKIFAALTICQIGLKIWSPRK